LGATVGVREEKEGGSGSPYLTVLWKSPKRGRQKTELAGRIIESGR